MTTQLQNLGDFPTTIQWLKEWSRTTQYVKNDTVISPTDKSLYILIVTSELGGDDPTTNTNWFPLTAPSFVGVADIKVDGNFIGNNGTATNVILTNYGVQSITAGANISITGTKNNPVINCTFTTPRLCLLFNQSSATNTGFPATGASTGVLTYGTSLSTFFNDCMTNGAPDPNGTFYIDMTSINFYKTGLGVLGTNRLFVYVRDTNLNLDFFFVAQYNTNIPAGSVGNITLGTVTLNVANARAAGLRAINAFVFKPGIGGNLTYKIVTVGDIKAVYSPTG